MIFEAPETLDRGLWCRAWQGSWDPGEACEPWPRPNPANNRGEHPIHV